jgi:hypothetical protein
MEIAVNHSISTLLLKLKAQMVVGMIFHLLAKWGRIKNKFVKKLAFGEMN